MRPTLAVFALSTGMLHLAPAGADAPPFETLSTPAPVASAIVEVFAYTAAACRRDRVHVAPVRDRMPSTVRWERVLVPDAPGAHAAATAGAHLDEASHRALCTWTETTGRPPGNFGELAEATGIESDKARTKWVLARRTLDEARALLVRAGTPPVGRILIGGRFVVRIDPAHPEHLAASVHTAWREHLRTKPEHPGLSLSLPLSAKASPGPTAFTAGGQGGPVRAMSRTELNRAALPVFEAPSEAYPHAPPGGVLESAEHPVDTFAADVDTTAYAVLRRHLMEGEWPPADAVRPEEVVNYFDYGYPGPDAPDATFAVHRQWFATPWNPDTHLVRIAVQARHDDSPRTPVGLVLLLDVSGSMRGPERLDLVRLAMHRLLDRLEPEDQVAVVTYAGGAELVLEPTAVREAGTIRAALAKLEAGGGTAGDAGLRLAYEQGARAMNLAPGAHRRVLLATDGDFNVGRVGVSNLEEWIARQRRHGIYLSVLGVGSGNYHDTRAQALAQAGNGEAAYLDTAAEAERVLRHTVERSLRPVADDLKLQVEWNPARVAEWRRVGYETRELAREDFARPGADAGEVGAGHAVTVLYEIALANGTGRLLEPLRYGAKEAPDDGAGALAEELAEVRLRWRDADTGEGRERRAPVRDGHRTETPDRSSRWAAGAAWYAELLRGARYTAPGHGWTQARAWVHAARGDDVAGDEAQLVRLIDVAQVLDETGR